MAGLYRDQLSAGEDYHELRPCHGIHFLMSDLLKNEPGWYNCYRMTNVGSHEPLSRHWNLHYVELGKFRKALRKGDMPRERLEQWCGFLSEPHDPAETLGESFGDNEGIREVHEMLGEFTQNERLREQYRLREAWLRDQRSAERERRDYRERLMAETRLRQKAEARERKAEAEKKKLEAEKQKAETELEEKERCSVLALREAGYADGRIAKMLGMPEDRVISVRVEQSGTA